MSKEVKPRKETMNTFKVGDAVVCVDSYMAGTPTVLKEGTVYEVIEVWEEFVKVEGDPGLRHYSRFEKVTGPKPVEELQGPIATIGATVKCVMDCDTFGLDKGRIYQVVDTDGPSFIKLAGLADYYYISRFELVSPPAEKKEFPGVDSDFVTMKSILVRGGAEVRSWHLREYTRKDGTVVGNFDGWYLIHGSPDYGPFADYVFDASGTIVADGVRANYDNGKTIEIG